MGEHTFVAEFETQRDRDRTWIGSPWHASKHAVILVDLEDHMRPDEVTFDRLHMWVRIPNLLYNPRDDSWGHRFVLVKGRLGRTEKL